jgi:hypothetical protein
MSPRPFEDTHDLYYVNQARKSMDFIEELSDACEQAESNEHGAQCILGPHVSFSSIDFRAWFVCPVKGFRSLSFDSRRFGIPGRRPSIDLRSYFLAESNEHGAQCILGPHVSFSSIDFRAWLT